MPATRWNIPHRIVTERLELRRYLADDAAAMSRVTFANKEHLVPFLPWARAEPLSPADRAALLDTFMADFDAGRDFALGVFLSATGEYIGGTGLHTRLGEGILEIGYWIAREQQRQGYVTEEVIALTQVALELAGAERVEIHHTPANVRSRSVPQRCGYAYEGRHLADLPGVPQAEPADIWCATRAHLTRAPLASAPRPHAFDSHGRELPWPA